MQYRRLGNGNLRVSVLCLGTMMFATSNRGRPIPDHASSHGYNDPSHPFFGRTQR
jgi:aryl-alcohol dehydrogenase-like predicted oxidoreductase